MKRYVKAGCYANSYIEADNEALETGPYVALVSVDGLDLGYVREASRGRGQTWIYLTDDPDEAKKLKSRRYNIARTADEIVIPKYYIPTEYKFLHYPHRLTDVDDLRSWVEENKGKTAHCYTLYNLVDIEYFDIDEAPELPDISRNDFESILVGYGK